jgi:hypothetical protein
MLVRKNVKIPMTFQCLTQVMKILRDSLQLSSAIIPLILLISRMYATLLHMNSKLKNDFYCHYCLWHDDDVDDLHFSFWAAVAILLFPNGDDTYWHCALCAAFSSYLITAFYCCWSLCTQIDLRLFDEFPWEIETKYCAH